MILRKFPILTVLLFAILGFAVYGNVLRGEFQFDDIPQIVHNPKVHDVTDIKSIWQAERYPTRFIPFLTFALNYSIGGLDPFGYHLVNIVIHIVNAWLIFWLVSQLLRAVPQNFSGSARSYLPLFTALIFLVHPIETQAVSYIYQRLASLAVLFYLLALNFFVKARREGSVKYFIYTFISAMLAMFSKEIAFTLPGMLLLTDFYFLKNKTPLSAKTKAVIFSLFLFVPLLCAFNFAYLIPQTHISESHGYEAITTATYFLTQFRVICVYLKLMVLPWGQNVDHDFPASQSLFDPATFACFTILVVLLSIGIALYRKNRLASFGIIWFFVTLSVESSFIVIRHVIFEHRMYLPSIGIILAFTALVFSYQDLKKRNVLLIAFVCVLSLLTIVRNQAWRTEVALWEDAARRSPDKPRTHLNLGAAYNKKGDWDSALKSYDTVLALQPNSAEALNNRANIFLAQGKIDAALKDVDQALEIKPQYEEIYVTRGSIYSYAKKFDEAFADYGRAIAVNPQSVPAYQNRGILFKLLKRYPEAINDLSQAIELQPGSADLYNERAVLYRITKRYDLALKDLDKAVKLAPRSVVAYNNRGALFKDIQKYALAVKDYSRAIEIDPQFVAAYNNRGNVLKILDHYDAAIADYSHAIQIDPGLAEAYFNRAVVLAAKKQYDLSIKDMETARDLGYAKAAAFVTTLKTIVEER